MTKKSKDGADEMMQASDPVDFLRVYSTVISPNASLPNGNEGKVFASLVLWRSDPLVAFDSSFVSSWLSSTRRSA